MDALAASLSLIKPFEECRLTAYQDSVGVWTIGWGHTGPGVYSGLVISQEQADSLLAADVGIAQHAVLLLCPVLAPHPYKQAAIIDFCYNLGAGRLQHATLRTLINEQHWAAVPAELMKWSMAGGVQLTGLARRRKAEAALWSALEP